MLGSDHAGNGDYVRSLDFCDRLKPSLSHGEMEGVRDSVENQSQHQHECHVCIYIYTKALQVPWGKGRPRRGASVRSIQPPQIYI